MAHCTIAILITSRASRIVCSVAVFVLAATLAQNATPQTTAALGVMCQRKMSKPSKEIDGAKVLEWAWSGNTPFGVICNESGQIESQIFGLAICQYDDSDIFYCFSCDSDWETEQDSPYGSAEDAKNSLPEQYRNAKVKWQKYE